MHQLLKNLEADQRARLDDPRHYQPQGIFDLEEQLTKKFIEAYPDLVANPLTERGEAAPHHYTTKWVLKETAKMSETDRSGLITAMAEQIMSDIETAGPDVTYRPYLVLKMDSVMIDSATYEPTVRFVTVATYS